MVSQFPADSTRLAAHAVELVGIGREHGSGETRVVALDGVDLSVDRGELVAIMGPSGSGKSTLLNVAGGLASPSQGAVLIDGVDITDMDARARARVRRRSIGYVFQSYNLIPALSAAENVSLPLELDGTNARAARRSALIALEQVGLGELADRFPDDMSGGQMQRVAIARALVGGRSILMADEPTGALDTHTGETVMALLRTRVDAGAAGILVTHEPRFAAWADRTIFLRDGRIADEMGRDSPEDLFVGIPS